MQFLINHKTGQRYVTNSVHDHITIFGENIPLTELKENGFVSENIDPDDMSIINGDVERRILTALEGRRFYCEFTKTETFVQRESDTMLDFAGNSFKVPTVPARFTLVCKKKSGYGFAVNASLWGILNLRSVENDVPISKWIKDLISWHGSMELVNKRLNHTLLPRWKTQVEHTTISGPSELAELRRGLHNACYSDAVSYLLNDAVVIKDHVLDSKERVYHVETVSWAGNLTIKLSVEHNPVFGINLVCVVKEGSEIIEEASWSAEPDNKVSEFDFLKAISLACGNNTILTIENVNGD